MNLGRLIAWLFQPVMHYWRQFVSLLLPNGRTSQQGPLLWVLAVAAERKLPLNKALEAFAYDSRGVYCLQIQRLGKMLDSGIALPDALGCVPGLLSKEDLLTVRVGYENGTLPESLRVAARRSSTTDASYKSQLQILVYVCAVLLVVTTIVGFIMYWIIPKFKKIFADFDTELPGVTILLISISDMVVNYWLLVPLFAASSFIFVALWMWIVNRFDLSWGPLDVENLWPRRHIPQVLRELSITVDSGKPLVSGLASLAKSHPVSNLRKRLIRVQAQVEMGDDLWKSMEEVRFLRHKHVLLLEASQLAQNLGWALRQTANNIERVSYVRWRAINQVLQPLAILAIALFVASIVTAMFMPLIQLLSDLS